MHLCRKFSTVALLCAVLTYPFGQRGRTGIVIIPSLATQRERECFSSLPYLLFQPPPSLSFTSLLHSLLHPPSFISFSFRHHVSFSLPPSPPTNHHLSCCLFNSQHVLACLCVSFLAVNIISFILSCRFSALKII